ncbi:LOW QUALITY PROTEIN: DNJ1 Tetratricopeptide repeat and J domain-containing co-chaperone DNJ1 [Candida maltosa Xu316]
MKVSLIYTLVNFVLLLNVTLGTSTDSFEKQLSEVDQLFSQQGPTITVLQAYEDVIRTAKSQSSTDINLLAKLFFKKAIIEINLNKETQAISDLKHVLDMDPLMKPAKDKLSDILVSKADFESLEKYLDKKKDSGIYQIMDNFSKNFQSAEMLFNEKAYSECIDKLNEIMISSPDSYEVNELFYSANLEMYRNDTNMEINYMGEGLPCKKVIVLVLKKLVDINPMKNLGTLSQFLLDFELQFENAVKVVKNCLKIDNEFKDCGKLSKYYSRFQDFLKILESYSIIQGHYYMNTENNVKLDDNDLIDPQIDFKFVVDFLFNDELKVSKLDKRHLPSDINDNYRYIKYQVSKFYEENGFPGVINDVLLIQDLEKLACQAYITIGDVKKAEPYCKAVNDSENPFLPKYIPEIDKYLKKNKFSKAETIMNKFNNNVKQTKLFTERWAKVEDYHRKLNEQRQQQYFHQQQQQQQHQHQQYRAQPPRAARKPKNDYYKILDIPRDADDKTIKKGYRTQTLKYHPDKYKGSDLTPEQIEKKMQEVNQAYEVLSDRDLRERYDRGDDPNDPTNPGQNQPQWQYQRGGGPGGGAGGHQNFNFNFGGDNQFFQQFFGGGQGNPFGHHKVKVKKNNKKRA